MSLTAGETDEPVTCDIKRLIRLPFSLHGGTGFQVKKIDLNDLQEFNPLQDAVVFDDEPVNIHVIHPVKIQMKGESFSLQKESDIEVPRFLAVFTLCRKWAHIN